MADHCRLYQELLLDINPDVTEFCPVSGFFDYLAVGTYQLDEATRQRHGRLHLYSLTHSSSSQHNSDPTLLLAATLDLPGIFDLQWTQLPNVHDQLCIGLALADGTLQLLSVKTAQTPSTPAAATLQSPTQQSASAVSKDSAFGPCQEAAILQQHQQQQQVQLSQLCSCQAVSEGMALALDWEPHQQQQQQQTSAQRVAVTSSSGAISVLQVHMLPSCCQRCYSCSSTHTCVASSFKLYPAIVRLIELVNRGVSTPATATHTQHIIAPPWQSGEDESLLPHN
jgi:hypothetical protein